MTSHEFTAWLETLMREPPPGPAEEEAWFLRQKPYLDAMNNADMRIEADFLHFIHHYVADADIRRRDIGGRELHDPEWRRPAEFTRAQDLSPEEGNRVKDPGREPHSTRIGGRGR
jgi:hypothetical protein